MRFLPLIVIVCGFTMSVGQAEIEIGDTSPRNSGATSVVPVPPPKSTMVQPVISGPDGDVLKFLNGDILHGTVLGVSTTDLRWRRRDVKEPVTFDLGNVGEVGLAPRVKSSVGQRTVVELTNGDALVGDLATLDDKILTLKTWYAGTLSIKRAMVQRVSFIGEIPDASYTGPNSIDEWKGDGNRGAWSFKKGALYGVGSGAIGRDVKLPDIANIEFDLAWHGQLYCNVGFGFDDPRQIYNSGGYMVQMSYTSIFLQRYRPQQGNNNMGANVELPELQRKSKMHVAIRVNKPKKTVALFFDGNLAKQWTEGEEWAAKGTGLIWLSQGQGQMRISNISVTGWDGRLETDVGATVKDADLVRLSNGDKVSGTVKSITNGQVVLAASFAEMNVPLERVAVIELATAKSERARRNGADVYAFFPDGRRLTFGLDKLDEQNIVGMTESYGRITAALGAFRRVQFHIYEKRDDSSDDDEWVPAVGRAQFKSLTIEWEIKTAYYA